MTKEQAALASWFIFDFAFGSLENSVIYSSVRETGSSPCTHVLIEGRGSSEHEMHVSYAGNVPLANILIERFCTRKHVIHVSDF